MYHTDRVVGLLGTGSFGMVVKAEECCVAIKISHYAKDHEDGDIDRREEGALQKLSKLTDHRAEYVICYKRLIVKSDFITCS